MNTFHLLFAVFTFLLTLCFEVNAQVSELDARLQGYVESFSLRPLSPRPQVNPELFRLGRDFFFDKRLSGNNNISCADCHHPRVMTHDALPLGLGEGAQGLEFRKGGRKQMQGKILARNTQALFNLAGLPFMFWDGRVHFDEATGVFTTPEKLPETFAVTLKSALAAQALFPMVNHEEMRGEKGTNEIADAATTEEAWDRLFSRVISEKDYAQRLAQAFPGETLNLAHVAEAIGHFEAVAFWAGDTAYDDYLKGKLNALTEVQKIGMDIFFGKGKCGECHKGEHLTDLSFQNVGVPQIGPGAADGDDKGRGDYTFRVPPLRNVSMTAPYMHNGAFKTLAQVIEHYDDVESSLRDYSFVNNYKNYWQKITGALKETDDLKLALLSKNLTPSLEFEESEEKALAEFIRGGLTDKRFLLAEIDGEYVTNLRIQLTRSGYEKLKAALPESARHRSASYYYFDVLTPEGLGLRELEKPIKLYFVEADGQTRLTYRKQLYKSSGAFDGIIAGGTFEDEETLVLSSQDALELSSLNHDFYGRLYSHTGGSIPAMEREVMRQDVLALSSLWHRQGLKNREVISDELNVPQDEIFFAPTSMNTKEEHLWSGTLDGIEVHYLLQTSVLRNEAGGTEETWAIELKFGKIQKKQLPRVLQSWPMDLAGKGLVAEESQGTTPSPSKLTEKVLLELFDNL